jgi:modulator of FtsH protease
MTAYQPALWHDLFVATAGAAAALTGLIFVAVSINLSLILKLPTLPPRAAETLSVTIGLLLLSVFVLVPGQSLTLLGAEMLALGAVLAAILLRTRLRLPRSADDPLIWTVMPIGVILVGTLPMIAAGISLLVGGGGGLYWLVPGLVLGFAGVLFNAWILLIEIQR